jgi:hypothetical protein
MVDFAPFHVTSRRNTGRDVGLKRKEAIAGPYREGTPGSMRDF